MDIWMNPYFSIIIFEHITIAEMGYISEYNFAVECQIWTVFYNFR